MKITKKQLQEMVKEAIEEQIFWDPYHPDPSQLFKHMGKTVQEILNTRVTIRTLQQNLGKVKRDASGVFWTDNYQDEEIDKAIEELQNIDWDMGEAYRMIEKLHSHMKKMVVK